MLMLSMISCKRLRGYVSTGLLLFVKTILRVDIVDKEKAGLIRYVYILLIMQIINSATFFVILHLESLIKAIICL